MGLLKQAENTTAFLKMGLLGFAGTGKTRTSSEIAIGLALLSKKKPVAFLDTETGSDFVKPLFDQAGIPLWVYKSRAFKDCLEIFKETVEGGFSCLIIDSVTHIWQEMCSAYAKRLKRKWGLQFQDWGRLKEEWRQLTDVFVNSPIHAFLCGRAGYEYDYVLDEQTGRKDLIKTGTKMKAESEMGYESSLLIEMERIRNPEKKGPRFLNVATILKDRTDQMNGKQIKFPGFKDFEPVLSALNLGGEHFGCDVSTSSEEMFDDPSTSAIEYGRQKDIELEEIKNALTKTGKDGTSAVIKKERLKLLEKHFGTASKTAMQGLDLEVLRNGRRNLEVELGLRKEENIDRAIEEMDSMAKSLF